MLELNFKIIFADDGGYVVFANEKVYVSTTREELKKTVLEIMNGFKEDVLVEERKRLKQDD